MRIVNYIGTRSITQSQAEDRLFQRTRRFPERFVADFSLHNSPFFGMLRWQIQCRPFRVGKVHRLRQDGWVTYIEEQEDV